MDFSLSEEHLMIRQAARDFAQNELLPGVIERDEAQKFPSAQIKKLGELGFMGMMVDPKYNGSGMDTLSYVIAMEELSKIDASASVVVSVNNSLVCWGLEAFGNEEQKNKYLTQVGHWCGHRRLLFIGTRGRKRCDFSKNDRVGQGRSLCVQRNKELDHQWRNCRIGIFGHCPDR